ncbi:MAG: response regulator [Verrucomicrobia bacterium]|nr:response regulator [Verrucomicrobiota bacterium]
MNHNPDLRADAPASTPAQTQTSAPIRILVADDEPAIRQLSTEVRIHSGYEVDTAEDVAAAWEALNIGYYDLMITDQNMPKLTGVELLKKLRAARMALPVILATGKLPKAEFVQYPWLQPAATLLKPFTIAELLRTVKEVLRAASRADDEIELSPNWPGQPFARVLRL